MQSLEQNISQFFGIEAGKLEELSAHFKHEHLPKGSFFTKKEAVCDKLSFIHSGYLRIYTEHNGKEITQWVASPGYFITEILSWTFEHRSRWHIEALVDCELYTIRRKDYEQLKKQFPQWKEMEALLLAKCFIQLEDRVLGFLSLNAEERLRQLYIQDKNLLLQVPQQYLASMLGMTPETFSRLRKRLQ